MHHGKLHKSRHGYTFSPRHYKSFILCSEFYVIHPKLNGHHPKTERSYRTID